MMIGRGKDSGRSLPGNQHSDQLAEEPLYDEPIRLIRPKRLAIGLFLIVLGMIWLALDNYFGVTTVPVAPSSRTAPVGIVQGTPQRTENLTLNVRLLTATAVPGRQAPVGTHFLLLTVQVENYSDRTIHLPRSAFTFPLGSRLNVAIAIYPGHAGPFGVRGVTRGATLQGTLIFALPNGAVPRVVLYKQAGSYHTLTWSL